MSLAGHRKEVHVSSFLQSSSQYVLADHQKCVYISPLLRSSHSTSERPPNGCVRYHLRSSSQRAWYATKRKCACHHFWRSHSVRGRPPNGSYAVSVSQVGSVCPLTTTGEGSAGGKARWRPRWNFVSCVVEIHRPRNSMSVLPSVTLFLRN